ncbi:MAG: DoxX family protein [Ferruginibacter sp.]|nr:DoxX family protein [Ferruginibacter sp.]
MRKLLSTNYSAGSFTTAMLLLRISAGVLMLLIGYDKLVNFNEHLPKMINFMGIGQKVSLILVIFAEFFCSAILIIGLFTRFACIPLIVTMCVALFKVHNADFFGDGQTATLFLTAYIVLLLVGPGKISIDSMIGK